MHPPEDAVSDILGSVLLVAITVLMAGALALLLLAFVGPERTTHANLAVRMDPGSGGWGTGDEAIRIQHLGGDAIRLDNAWVEVRIGSSAQRFEGASLGSAWGDGSLTIGETWIRTTTIPAGAPVHVGVAVDEGAGPRLVVLEKLRPGATSTTVPCPGDTNRPTVILWTQSPATVTATHTGAIMVTAHLTDDCWGVNPSVVPNLLWRLGTSGPFTDTGPMSSAGVHRWTGAMAGQAWTAGTTIQYLLGNLTDLGGNSGPSPVQSTVVVADCSQDNVPPTAATVTQLPSDVRTDTTGAVTVTVAATDNCSGVDPDTVPVLRFRLNDGTNPGYGPVPTPMNRTVSSPCCTWRGTIPDQAWATRAGVSLDYFVDTIRDRNGNLGASSVRSDVIQPIYTYTPCASGTAVTGTLSAFQNACSASAASDSGAEATLAEAASAPTPSTQVFNANGAITSNAWTLPLNTFASDDAYATFATDNPTTSHDLRLSMQDPVVQTGTISSVRLFAEVRVQGNDGWTLMACLAGGSCTALSPTLGSGVQADNTVQYDISAIRPGGGAWSWSDIVNLEGVVRPQQQGFRDGTWFVDRVWVDVTASVSTYSMNVRLEWSGVPQGAGARVLELQYRTTGDTFRLEVCQDALATCGSWVQRGTLNSGSATGFTYTLTSAEFRLTGSTGAPRIRFIDSNPSGNVQGNLHLDWARVATL